MQARKQGPKEHHKTPYNRPSGQGRKTTNTGPPSHQVGGEKKKDEQESKKQKKKKKKKV